MRRLAILLFIALSALGTSWLGGAVLVPRVGDSMARTMVVAADLVVPRGTVGPMRPDAAPRSAAVVNDNDTAPHPGGRPHPIADRDGPVAAIDISRDRVARLGAHQLRGIFATDALDASGHALGARLHGVAGLGVGLADGDVVTQIDGRVTANVGDATAAALAAYASGEATAHATVLRRGHVVRVTVHIPAREPASRPAPRVEM